MADNGRTSLPLYHHIGGSGFSGWINLAFISMRIFLFQEQNVQHISCHIVLEFLVPVILDFLKLQCQVKGVSPFETHPKTMWVAIASLLMYSFAYDSELRLGHARPNYAQVVRCGTMLFGWLSSVSLASILFPSSVGPVLYLFLYILFSAGELQCRRRLRALWNWLRERMMGNVPQEVHVQERQMRRALINWGWFTEYTSRNREIYFQFNDPCIERPDPLCPDLPCPSSPLYHTICLFYFIMWWRIGGTIKIRTKNP